MPCSRSSPRTTPIRWRPSITWPGRTITPASTNSSACTAWASRCTSRWSATSRASSTGRAASTRRSARTRRCWPTWCAACWRTAPTPRSSTASRTSRFRWTNSSPIRWRWWRTCTPRKARSACRIRKFRCRAISMVMCVPIRQGSIWRTSIGWRRCRLRCWPVPARSGPLSRPSAMRHTPVVRRNRCATRRICATWSAT